MTDSSGESTPPPAPDPGREGERAAAPQLSCADLAQQALDSLAEGVLVIDGEDRVRLANAAAVRWLDLTDLTGRHVRDIEVCPHLGDLLADARRRGEGRNLCLLAPPRVPPRRLHLRLIPLLEQRVCLLTIRAASALAAEDENDLWQAEKMAALGRLAASVAHEVRNPLGAVDIQLQLMRESVSRLDPAVGARFIERLDIARAEMRRLDGIVQNFLRFSRPPALHLSRVEPAALLGRVHALVAPEARQRGIGLSLQPGGNLPELQADENVLSQALLNVIINAFQAVGEGGRVALSTTAVGTGRVRFRIEDDGCGIPPEDLERVLEYYYTTKDTGSGLGLSIAQGIVQQHGGHLHLASRPGAGTTVDLELPAAAG